MTIASEISRLQCAKSDICTAIENKGVTVGGVTLSDYAGCIDAIQGTGMSILDVVVPSGNTVCLKYPSDGSYGIDVAAGGTKTLDGGYYIHCYTDSGQLYMNYTYLLTYLGVGGGGGGGRSTSGTYSAGGGGGGQICHGIMPLSSKESLAITIGCGGAGGTNTWYGCDGGDTCIGDMIMKGGCGGYCLHGGNSGSGCSGAGYKYCAGYYYAGGGGGACGNGSVNGSGGTGGIGYCGMGGGGGTANCYGCDGGGHGNYKGDMNASNYGGGGGSGFSVAGGCGCQGVVDICYACDGSDGVTSATGGNCCYLCGDICVHRFTSDGTFTIVS